MEDPINKNPKTGNSKLSNQNGNLNSFYKPKSKQELLGLLSHLKDNLEPEIYGNIYTAINKVIDMKNSNSITINEIRKIIKKQINSLLSEEQEAQRVDLGKRLQNLFSIDPSNWESAVKEFGIEEIINSQEEFEGFQNWLQRTKHTGVDVKAAAKSFKALPRLRTSLDKFSDRLQGSRKETETGKSEPKRSYLKFSVNLKDLGPALYDHIEKTFDNLTPEERDELYLDIKKVPRGVGEGNQSSVKTFIRKYIDSELVMNWIGICDFFDDKDLVSQLRKMKPKEREEAIYELMLKEENILRLYQYTLEYFNIDPATLGAENAEFTDFLRISIGNKINSHLQKGLLLKNGEVYTPDQAKKDGFANEVLSKLEQLASQESALKDLYLGLKPLFATYSPQALYGWMQGKISMEDLEPMLDPSADVNEYDPLFNQETSNQALYDAYFDLVEMLGLETKAGEESQEITESLAALNYLLNKKKLQL